MSWPACPIYGKLRFKDRARQRVEKGVNVGDEWTYRSFIEGGSQAAAIWTFEGISEATSFPKGLPVEMTIEVFRTYKGDMTRAFPAASRSAIRRRRETVEVRIFAAKKFATDVQFIPRKLLGSSGETVRSLPRPGRPTGSWKSGCGAWTRRSISAWPRPTLYFRRRDASFGWNFAKGYLGIWLQMVLVIGLGVMFSTFLSGPVALIATVGTAAARPLPRLHRRVGLGQDDRRRPVGVAEPHPHPAKPGSRKWSRGSAPTWKRCSTGCWKDSSASSPRCCPISAASASPTTSPTDSTSPAACRGDDLLWQSVFRALGFLLPVFVAGYLFLKTREVAE